MRAWNSVSLVAVRAKEPSDYTGESYIVYNIVYDIVYDITYDIVYDITFVSFCLAGCLQFGTKAWKAGY